MTPRSLLITTALLAGFSSSLDAEVYKHTDEQGNVTYSDESIDGAETVDVKPVTTVTLPKMEQVEQATSDSQRGSQPEPQATYDSARFTAPENESAFHSGSGDVVFSVTSTPGLQPGHRFEVALDGQPIGQNRAGQFSVTNVNRGTHNASVNIIGPNGEIIHTGENISFTIHRPSVLN
ncbi:uncharacterized protein DUF4124 [Tamilnaduibacter salinus]|uniref:Uncharacterized protein DUF4124 n=1 Tax=Tamilnaduibacter salinus TaxID=1484056 RepID=A0A2U1CTX1_9GAMM|nr:DUF4124 domain-containing protein [Tamilnaduibacter salinus]PVY70327.1 uncharacterized protein DUF4124 [Tamilnaduibacter salinus]